MGPGDLSLLLEPLELAARSNGNILVGIENSDDAGVYRLNDDLALVQTVDVITPIVDDPADFGYIAAINSLSDIYAMGGEPLTALTFLAFQPCDLPLEAAALILEGARQALSENGCVILGGHTVEDAEIKFGLAVTGTVNPGKVITNSGAGDGDLIYLTKPLGTGIAATALKGELLSPDLEMEAVRWMKTSNREAARAMAQAGVSAATDVTGFGLLGHLWEMCLGAGLGALVDLYSVPVMAGVEEMVRMGMVPAGAYRNREHLAGKVSIHAFAEERVIPLFDPQTSGGLLMAVSPDHADRLEIALDSSRVKAYRIGMFRKEPGIDIVKS
ncbi:MAG: selenide, water dikinase SelD [bacterium]|nr:selenide, water dikinase SelD [bacterium]